MSTTRDQRRCRNAGAPATAALMISAIMSSTTLSPSARAEEPMPTHRSNRVPFRLLDNLIYLAVKADGHELNVLLDTGASASVIDAGKAEEMGLALRGPTVGGAGGGEKAVTATPVHLRELVVGEETLRDQTLYAIPLPGLSQAFGAPVDGVLGHDILGRHAVEIDYLARCVTFHDADEFRDDEGRGESIPFTLEHNHIQVAADLLRAGEEPLRGKFTVDLGMSSALILNAPFVKDHRLLDGVRPGPATSIGMGVGGEMQGVFGRVGGLRLGSFTLNEPVTAFSLGTGGYFASNERAGNIGAEVMRRFRVIVDYPRRRLILEKNASFDEPFEHDASGLSLVAAGPDLRTVKVHAVSEGSPASKAGVRAGDVVATIDGSLASGRPLDDWRRSLERAGETRILTLRRGDEEVKAEIALERRY